MRTWLLWCACLATLVGAPASAQRLAESAEPLGYVVRIDFKKVGDEEHAEVYVDLGTERGASDGAKVTLLRDLTVRHPITKKTLRDLFTVAEAKIDNARGSMSMLRLEVPVARALRVGDRAVIGESPDPVVRALPAVPAGQACPPRADRPCPPCAVMAGGKDVDAAARAVLATWRATLGKPPLERIAYWKDYVARHPASSHVDFAQDEIRRLWADGRVASALQQAQETAAAAAAALSRAERRRAPAREVAPASQAWHAVPREVREQEPVAVAAATRDPAVRGMLLFYRQDDATRYQPLRLKPAGDGYFAGTIPADAVRGPRLAYLLETIDDRGRRAATVGSEAEPASVAVRETSRAEDLRNRSVVSLRSEYVDFNRFRRLDDGDHYWVFEGDFKYRFRTVLHALQAGFGTYNGVGGTFDQTNQFVGDHRDIGYNYGYLGAEFQLHAIFGVIARTLVGLNAEGLAAGIEGRVRIGREQGTNLQLGVATAQKIGTLGLIQLTWDVVKDLPMTGTVEVTDQPTQGDIGVRFIYDLGWRATSWWYPTLRVSFQARTIEHYGFGAGLASVFAW